jgi:hypothetical protein
MVKYGTSTGQSRFLDERRAVIVQRHKCHVIQRSHALGKAVISSEESPLRVWRKQDAREVCRLRGDL